MTTITLPPFTLPDELAEKAKAKGLFSPESLAKLVSEALRDDAQGRVAADSVSGPPGYDPRFAGATTPELVGSVTFLGDVVAPLNEAWEADS